MQQLVDLRGALSSGGCNKFAFANASTFSANGVLPTGRMLRIRLRGNISVLCVRQCVLFCCSRRLPEPLRFLRKWEVFVRISRAGSIKKPPDAAGGVDPWQNRTVDNLLRRQVLYPAELKGRVSVL